MNAKEQQVLAGAISKYKDCDAPSPEKQRHPHNARFFLVPHVIRGTRELIGALLGAQVQRSGRDIIRQAEAILQLVCGIYGHTSPAAHECKQMVNKVREFTTFVTEHGSLVAIVSAIEVERVGCRSQFARVPTIIGRLIAEALF